jgi:preprotein translocase subunit SecB
VADVIQRGGFPPVNLAEINFQAMFEQQQAAAASAAQEAPQIIV